MRILAIDGGGIKGIYAASFLEYFEARSGKLTAENFDLICGTSTGGILALAIAAKLPAKKVTEFYENWGPKIFRTSRLPGIITNSSAYKLLRIAFKSKYSNSTLKSALMEVFGERRLKELFKCPSPVRVCIPTIDILTGRPRVFKTPHHKDLTHDSEYYLWQAALATSSAPVFLPVAKLESPEDGNTELFIDGGLWANNPTLVAIVEATTYLGANLNEIRILSLGNIVSRTTIATSKRMDMGIASWGEKLVTCGLENQASAVDLISKLIFRSLGNEDGYVRIEENVSDDNGIREMDNASRSNIDALKAHGKARAAHESRNAAVMHFFKDLDPATTSSK